MDGKRNTYSIVWGNLKETARLRWQNNIKMVGKET